MSGEKSSILLKNSFSQGPLLFFPLILFASLFYFGSCTLAPSPENTLPPTASLETVTDFIDKRDGKKYPIQKIGQQTWLATNLNFETLKSYCYDNQPENCQAMGRLYDFKNAKNACPKGWHLPSDVEWKILETQLGMEKDQVDAFRVWRGETEGTQLKDLWQETFPGIASSKGNKFQGKDTVVRYWSTSPGPSGSAFLIYRQLTQTEGRIYSDQIPSAKLCCVRCLKN